MRAEREDGRDCDRRLSAIADAGGSAPVRPTVTAITAHPAERRTDASGCRSISARIGPIDEVRLIPARPTDFADTPGFGFPVRFRVEASDDVDLHVRRDRARRPHGGRRRQSRRRSGQSFRSRASEAATSASRRRSCGSGSNDYVFALGEMQVFGGRQERRRGRPVTALDSIEAGRWAAQESRRWLRQPAATARPERRRRGATVSRTRPACRTNCVKSRRDAIAWPKRRSRRQTRRERAAIEARLAVVETELRRVSAGPMVYSVVCATATADPPAEAGRRGAAGRSR